MNRRPPRPSELQQAAEAIRNAWAFLYPVLRSCDMDYSGLYAEGVRLEEIGRELAALRREFEARAASEGRAAA